MPNASFLPREIPLRAVPPKTGLREARKRPAAYEAWKLKSQAATCTEKAEANFLGAENEGNRFTEHHDLKAEQEQCSSGTDFLEQNDLNADQCSPSELEDKSVAEQCEAKVEVLGSSGEVECKSIRVGMVLESIGCAIMRQGEGLESTKISRLPGKARVEVIVLGETSKRRVCVRDNEGVEGWVSIAKENGELLWLLDAIIDRGSVLFAVEDSVRVFYDAESSDVICVLERGEGVSVTGVPVKNDCFTMIPVQLRNGACGAIQYELLQHRKPVPLQDLKSSSPVSLEPAWSGPLALELVYAIPFPVIATNAEGESTASRDAATMPYLVAYGDALSAHLPAEASPSYAYGFTEALSGRGLQVQIVGCGLPGRIAESLAAESEEKELRDTRKRAGVGIETLVQPLCRGGRSADLVLVTAGTVDVLEYTQPYNFLEPDRIVQALQQLHSKCHALGVRTVALGIPDFGGRFATVQSASRRRAVNSALARWVRGPGVDSTKQFAETRPEQIAETRPELFLNPASFVPYGPRSRADGLWRDGLNMTEKGVHVLGERLAARLAPLVSDIHAERVLACGAMGDETGAPSIEAYLQAFAADAGNSAIAAAAGACDWEIPAARRIQIAVRHRAAKRSALKKTVAWSTTRTWKTLLKWCSCCGWAC